MNRPVPSLLIGIVVLLFGCASPNAREESHRDKPFPETTNAMADIDAALARSAATDKRLLFVIGANWCHDSKALLNRLDGPAIASLVEEQYEVQLINVGWFERGFDVAERFGLAIYTHTPTVLIIEPRSERVLNAHDQQIFRDADKMTEEEVLAYFEAKAEPTGWTKTVSTETAQSPAYQSLMAEILVFEQKQAKRIRAGYQIVAPKLEADTDDLAKFWRPLKELRYSLPDDLLALREAARDRVARGETGISLDYPAYKSFPWE